MVSVVTLKCKASIIAFSNTLKINFIYLFIFYEEVFSALTIVDCFTGNNVIGNAIKKEKEEKINKSAVRKTGGRTNEYKI